MTTLPNPADCCSGPCTDTVCGPAFNLTAAVQQIAGLLLPIINAKDYGIKGDGATDDTVAILALIAQFPGRLLFFPASTYKVTYQNTGVSNSITFPLKSNTGIIGEAGTVFQLTNQHPNLGALFGPDPTALPVSNLLFQGFTAIGQNLISAAMGNCIGLMIAQDGPAESVINTVITNCVFKWFGSAVYVVQRTSVGSETRQVRGVKVYGCRGENNLGSFVTADGQEILIENNVSYGYHADPTQAFDGVSIHSGMQVSVIGNLFFDHGNAAAIGVNIRNNVNSLCGSREINVIGNTFRNCLNKCVGISLQAGENTFGVKNVLIAHNNLLDAQTMVVVDGSANLLLSTPFQNFTIVDNVLEVVQTGINVVGKGMTSAASILIQGNNLRMLNTNTNGILIQCNNARTVNIADNQLYMLNGVGQLALSMTSVDLVNVGGNSLNSANASAISVVFSNMTNLTFNGNNLYAAISFINVMPIEAGDNFIQTLSTVNNHIVGQASWGYAGGRFWGTRNALPTSETWEVGDYAWNDLSLTNLVMGWVAKTKGTLGTLVGVTASTVINTTLVTCNSVATLSVNQYITIAGVTGQKKILSINSGLNQITVDTNCDATVNNAAVAYSAATMATWGAIV